MSLALSLGLNISRSAGASSLPEITNSIRSPVDLDGVGWNQSFSLTTSGATETLGSLTIQGISADGLSGFPQIRGGGASDATTVADNAKCSVTYYVKEGSAPKFYVGLVPTAAIQSNGTVFEWSGGAPVFLKTLSFHAGTTVDSHEIESSGSGFYRIRSTVQNTSGGDLSYYPFIYPTDASVSDTTVYTNAVYIGGINVYEGDFFAQLETTAN